MVMRKYSILFLSALTIGSLGFVFTSCDDDPPPAKPQLSFATTSVTAKESDADLEIQVVLDKAASEDITVEYSLSGTALDDVTAGNNQPVDYEVVSDFDYGEIEIEKGETTGTISLNLLSDGEFEDDETIEISIDNVSTDAVEITRDDEVNITVKQEDGRIILLEWPAPSGSGQADMDIVLRVGDNTTTWAGVLSGAANGSFEGPEVLFIPKAVTYAAYGLSYTYYDGTLDPLEFTATFIEFADGAAEAEAQWDSFDGVYTAVNKNKWTDINTTIVVQTFQKTGGAFTAPSSPITIPSSGSRMASNSIFNPALKRTHMTYKVSDRIKQILK